MKNEFLANSLEKAHILMLRSLTDKPSIRIISLPFFLDGDEHSDKAIMITKKNNRYYLINFSKEAEIMVNGEYLFQKSALILKNHDMIDLEQNSYEFQIGGGL